MQQSSVRNWRLNDLLLSLIVLLFLLAYTYGILFYAPYPGFYFNPTSGEVLEIYQPDAAVLQVGDLIRSIGPISLDDFHENKNLNIFQGIEPGQNLEIVITRNGETLTID